MFTFTPLLGARSSSPASASLLELDNGIKILVDAGWDAAFSSAHLSAVEDHVSTLSIILLTHPTLDHLGAYAHYCKHVPLFAQVPCYATTPVVNLGRALVQDVYGSSISAAGTVPTGVIANGAENGEGADEEGDASPSLLLQPPSAEEIATYFNLINPLKYSQPHQPIPSPFSPSVAGLTITAYGAGHTLGGTIWHIQHGLESIVYAADWSQARESLYSGAAWLSGGSEIIEPLRRPTSLICSSKGVEKTQPLSRKKRDDTMISLIRETIAQGGKVLIPTDSSARVLELAYLLNQTWRENIDGPHSDTYKHTRIYFASRSASASVRYLNSMLEWVDDAVRSEAEAAMSKTKTQGGQVSNPLDWKFVRQLERKSQVERALERKRPCVMLASDASLEWGFSRQALLGMAGDTRNLIILTERLGGVGKGLGRQLWEAFEGQQGSISAQSGAKVVGMDGATVDLREASTTGLNADETALYQTYMARQQQLHSTLQGDNTTTDPSAPNITEEAEEDDSESEDEDEDAEHQGRALNLSAQMTQSSKRKVAGGLTDSELGINILLRGTNVFDYDVRNRRGREKVFPFVAKRVRDDDFGALIKPEDYLRAEERDEVDGMDMREGTRKETEVGKKRKWDDVAPGSAAGGQAKKAELKNGKRQKRDREPRKARQPDDIDAAIARATGETPSNGGGASTAVPAAALPESSEDDIEDDDESDYEPEDSGPAGPQKLVWTPRELPVHCRVTYVDFAGLHEKRDLQMLIPLIRPRKLVLIAGSESETELLAEECRGLLRGDGADAEGASNVAVFAPRVGEVIDASVDTNAWTLKLSRELVSKLVWQDVKGLGVVALTGFLDAEALEDAATSSAQKPASQQEEALAEQDADSDSPSKTWKRRKPNPETPQPTSSSPTSTTLPSTPILHLLPSYPTANPTLPTPVSTTSTRPVHVGDLRLAHLRELLRANGHVADFRGEGTLLIDGVVIVRKRLGGRLEVEGWCGGGNNGGMGRVKGGGMASFLGVRREVYRGLAVVAGV